MKQLLIYTSILVCGMCLGASASWDSFLLIAASPDEVASFESYPEEVETAASLSEAFQYVADHVKPSVVSVSTTYQLREARIPKLERSPVPEEFRRFFGDDIFDRMFDFELPQSNMERSGLGTGVIISDDGYIVTNNHVIRSAEDITVTLSDEREYSATVVGTDTQTDIAVLKIEASGLTPADFGDSADIHIGEWVLAVGSPFGLDQTVTAGIVSATGRAGVGVADYEDFIQTDAAINPGNSGGPLVNLRGEVVGINTAIVSGNGGYMGVGFAIPSQIAKSVAESLIAHGRVERGRLGVMMQELTPDLADAFGYSGQGVLVGEVQPESPAEVAGLKAGDIITRLNGDAMASMHVLRNRVAATAPGSEIEVEVYRDGQYLTIPVTVDHLQPSVSNLAIELPAWGLSLRDLTPDVRNEFGYDDDVMGAVVAAVEPGSSASRIDLAPGDVIVSINGTPIDSAAVARDLLEAADSNKGIRLQVMSDNVFKFVILNSRG